MLTRQHNQVRALLQQLQALPSHKTGGTAEDLAARKSIVDMITVRLTQHETAEEKYLWPTVRKALDDGDGLADQALSQEQEGTDTLARLGKLEPDTDEFDEHVEQLVAQLRKHVAYEGQVFARLREAVPDSERERLGRKLETAPKKGPTSPHRRAPRKAATAVKAAATGAAAADRARDASLAQFIKPGTGVRQRCITSWTWTAVPDPAPGLLATRGRPWEVTRLRAYQAHLAGHTLRATFIRVAAFLNLAAANARATSVDLTWPSTAQPGRQA